MSPDGPQGGGAGGEVGVWSVVGDRHPLDPPHYHGVEGVRSPEAELMQHGKAHSSTRRRRMLRIIGQPDRVNIYFSQWCRAPTAGREVDTAPVR